MPACLKIENIGVCPPEGFTVLGVSLADTESTAFREDQDTVVLRRKPDVPGAMPSPRPAVARAPAGFFAEVVRPGAVCLTVTGSFGW